MGFGMTAWQGGYLAISLTAAVLPLAYLALFEKRRQRAEKVVLIALLSALSAIGRGLFAAIPSVQPSSFIIIIAGMVFGTEAGFMTGALTAVLSGFLLGIGPWTLWQLFGWGLMGWLAGFWARLLINHKGLRIAYCVTWGFLFGWIMNLWMLLSVDSVETGLPYILGVYAASFVFDCAHAAANGLLMAAGGDVFIKTLTRIAVKYGLRKQ